MKRKLSTKKDDDNTLVTKGYLKEQLNEKFDEKLKDYPTKSDLDKKLREYPTKAYLKYELDLITSTLNEINDNLLLYRDEVLTYKDYLAKFINDFRQEMLFLGNHVNIHDEKIDDNTSRISILEDKMILRDGPFTSRNKKDKS